MVANAVTMPKASSRYIVHNLTSSELKDVKGTCAIPRAKDVT